MSAFRVSAIGLVLCGLAASAAAQAPAARQIGQMVLEGVPEWEPALRERMLQYLEVRRASLLDVSEDGQSVLITTRFGNAAQLHVVSQPLGARRQVTFFDEPVDYGFFVPGAGGRQIIFSKDKGGDERDNYYRLNLDDGRWTLLTDGKSRHTAAIVSRSGRWMAYTCNARKEPDFDVYVKDLTSAEPAKLAWQVEGQHYVVDFSPDESKLMVQQYIHVRARDALLPARPGQRPATAAHPAVAARVLRRRRLRPRGQLRVLHHRPRGRIPQAVSRGARLRQLEVPDAGARVGC
jgi:hypothetical protein